MNFGSLYRRFMQSLQRHKLKAESSRTLASKGPTSTTKSHLSVSSTDTKPLKTWRSLKTLLSSKPVENGLPFKATQRPSCYIVLVHLVPVGAVGVITWFNLYGYWIGKELSGTYNENAPKLLALQLTTKVHDLLMLASLSEALLTQLLKSLAIGHELPFGSLTAVPKFKGLSYLWSRDLRATCAARYPRRSLLVPLLLVCTMLGVTLRPSSATALIPRLGVWPAGEAVMTLNTSSDLLWPSSLQAIPSDPSICNHSSLGCLNSMVWDSIAANLFSYWGHTTTGVAAASPQHINVPGISSLRSMNIRVKGSVGPSEPNFTVASVQHAVIGDMVNHFRFLTFPSQSARCKRTWSPAQCSYKDVSWFVSAMQPAVSTACWEKQLNTSSVEFPAIRYAPTSLKMPPISFNDDFEDETQPQFRWVPFDSSPSLHASIGAVIRLGTATNTQDFACTIQAQWAESNSSTSYTGTYYIIDSMIPALDSLTLIDQEYKRQTVTIDSQWAQQSVESLAGSQTNTTAFEEFMHLGEATKNVPVKLETVLSVLFAEKMAHIGSSTVPLSISSKDLFLKIRGDLSQNDMAAAARTSATNRTEFLLKTSMTGYSYGLYTTSGLSTSMLISIGVLLIYAVIALVHLASLYISKDPYIESWREERELLVTCLQSRFRPAILKMDPGDGGGQGQGQEQKRRDGNVRILKDIVLVTGREGQPELSFRRMDWPDGV
ncbi:hypothetical protein EPUS_03938 [Endocarpon pusillum Z07020]|uniref:Uncharacterized protein n=1 Tax=Endocarpon pusillum (strain Z07020 / HMAS-L-300199) TaxID=1263415 RepID=U1HUZ7_ENDPU|nr:uncharacterized protein EPUS_03938 [Endocarpon pusillum Z07020]ERF74500.1 hypothetical protein EPUS_03938 [Endocarpon pusillum Z07020]